MLHPEHGAGQPPGHRGQRVTHLGFEVRADLRLDGGAPETDAWAQLSRGTAAALNLTDRSTVWVTYHPTKVTGPAPEPERAPAGRSQGRGRALPVA